MKKANWLMLSCCIIDFLGETLTIAEMNDETKWERVFHPDDIEGFTQHFKKNLAQKTPYQYEARIRNAQGEYRWIIISARSRFSESGQFAGYVGSLIDITKRKQSELALQESEARFRVMADAAPVHIWMSNSSGQVEYFNKQLLNFLQIPLEEAQSGTYLLSPPRRSGDVAGANPADTTIRTAIPYGITSV